MTMQFKVCWLVGTVCFFQGLLFLTLGGALRAQSLESGVLGEAPMSGSADAQPVASLDLGNGQEVHVATVDLGDGNQGIEIVERTRAEISTPSMAKHLGVGLIEIVNATSRPGTKIPETLLEASGPPRAGAQGWLLPELERSSWASEDRHLLAELELDNGNQLTFLAVDLGNGEQGLELMERGFPGNPSVALAEGLEAENLAEVFFAVSKPGTPVPDLLIERFGPPKHGPQGWLQERWEKFPEDFPRATCNDSTFSNYLIEARTVGGSLFQYIKQYLNWQGTFSYTLLYPGNRITDYFSTACNQHYTGYQYRVRRKNNSSDPYINWTINFFDPGEWYYYRWSAPSGLYGFRTEINHGYGSAGNTDIGIRWSLR